MIKQCDECEGREMEKARNPNNGRKSDGEKMQNLINSREREEKEVWRSGERQENPKDNKANMRQRKQVRFREERKRGGSKKVECSYNGRQ